MQNIAGLHEEKRGELFSRSGRVWENCQGAQLGATGETRSVSPNNTQAASGDHRKPTKVGGNKFREKKLSQYSPSLKRTSRSASPNACRTEYDVTLTTKSSTCHPFRRNAMTRSGTYCLQTSHDVQPCRFLLLSPSTQGLESRHVDVTVVVGQMAFDVMFLHPQTQTYTDALLFVTDSLGKSEEESFPFCNREDRLCSNR